MTKVHAWLARLAAANARCEMFAAQWAADGMETAAHVRIERTGTSKNVYLARG